MRPATFLISLSIRPVYGPRLDKTNKMSVRPVWSESFLYAHRVAKDPRFLHADSEDSDQTGRIPRLIWVFAGRTGHFAGFVMLRLIYAQTPVNTVKVQWTQSHLLVQIIGASSSMLTTNKPIEGLEAITLLQIRHLILSIIEGRGLTSSASVQMPIHDYRQSISWGISTEIKNNRRLIKQWYIISYS